jgi:hypothetical protein
MATARVGRVHPTGNRETLAWGAAYDYVHTPRLWQLLSQHVANMNLMAKVVFVTTRSVCVQLTRPNRAKAGKHEAVVEASNTSIG